MQTPRRVPPGSQKLSEMKEEMLHNLYDKYDDLVAVGRSPAAAYNSAVAGVGDISDLLDEVSREDVRREDIRREESPAGQGKEKAAEPLTDEERETLRRWRDRSAILVSVAVSLYILCVTPTFFINNAIGELLMFLMIAAATAILIFNSKTKPAFARDDDEDDNDGPSPKRDDDRPRRSPVYTAISTALWVLTVCVYLLVSFLTGFWHITWMIFLITVAVDGIIKAIFDLRR